MTLTDASEIVLIDFEFIAGHGERPRPVCCVARELRSGRLFRLWVEHDWPAVPPFASGPDVITAAYYNSAEMGCYFALDWPLPRLTLDLYSEFRVATNGLTVPGGRRLPGALRWFGLDALEVATKDHMIKRILAGPPYSEAERVAILDYCQSDVDALVKLLPRLVDDRHNLIPALWRAEYMKVMAGAEWSGVPVDGELYRRMVEHWPELQAHAIDRVNAMIPVFENRHFRTARFRSWLADRALLERWPVTADGSIALDDDTFRQQAALHAELEPLRQVRQMLGQLKKPGLQVGADNRNRCLLSAFATITGRNAPSTTEYIFGCPSWMRGLIRPEVGTALAYVDWSSQEFGIAAALSGDTNMQAAYHTGNCYLGFAQLIGAVPPGATKEQYPAEHSLFKSIVLGTQYMISAPGLAAQLEVTLPEAEDFLDHHKRVFSRFWQWSDSVSDYGQLYGELTAAFGWKMQMGPQTKPRTLRNFPMQSNAGEMLRLACVFADEAGVDIVAPVHDAILVEAPAADIDQAVHRTQAAMRRASEYVLAGFPLRTDAAVIHHPDRFHEKRGRDMWSWIEGELSTLAA